MRTTPRPSRSSPGPEWCFSDCFSLLCSSFGAQRVFGVCVCARARRVYVTLSNRAFPVFCPSLDGGGGGYIIFTPRTKRSVPGSHFAFAEDKEATKAAKVQPAKESLSLYEAAEQSVDRRNDARWTGKSPTEQLREYCRKNKYEKPVFEKMAAQAEDGSLVLALPSTTLPRQRPWNQGWDVLDEVGGLLWANNPPLPPSSVGGACGPAALSLTAPANGICNRQ